MVPAVWDALDRLYDRTGPAAAPVCLACAYTAPTGSFAVRTDTCMFAGRRLDRLECPKCGCVFGPPKYLETPPELVDLDYRLLYTDYSEVDSTAEEIRAFRALDPKPGGVYLNWGSGAWSESVERLRSEGFDVWGYEPHADVQSEFVVRRRDQISARFDGVFSNNLIEHLFDPAAQFADWKSLLKPGGRMAHASPCYEWLYAFTRFHVFFPLGDSPARLAERTGFRLAGAEDEGEFHVRVFESQD
jgi:SAM-dependent methyltransferase